MRAVTFLAALLFVFGAVGPTTVGGATTSNQLNVTAGEYVYQLKGKPAPGWVTIDFSNAGTEMHMMAVLALRPGATVAQLKAAVASPDPNAGGDVVNASVGDQGSISGAPTTIGPKQRTTATLQLPAGRYGLLCFVPAAGDGQPHAAHGMIKIVTVAGAKSAAKPPVTQATVTLRDDGIDFPLTNPGRNLSLKITNTGTAPHGFTLVKLADGKSLDDAKAYFDALFSGAPPAGDAPGVLVGGLDNVAPGKSGYLQQRLTPGHYGYVSTQSDQSGTDAYVKGLKGEFTVK